MIKRTILFVLASLGLGCTPAFQGEYADPTSREIVDDRWNDTDSRKSAEVMIDSMLKKAWLEDYRRKNPGKKPVVIVDRIENRTNEHLDAKNLTERIRDELINSGKIRFVNAERRQRLLDEIKYQQSSSVNQSTAVRAGRHVGADFMLGGAISSQVNQMDDYKVVVYQINLTLTNLETAEYVWSEKFPIKKRFRRSGVSW